MKEPTQRGGQAGTQKHPQHRRGKTQTDQRQAELKIQRPKIDRQRRDHAHGHTKQDRGRHHRSERAQPKRKPCLLHHIAKTKAGGRWACLGQVGNMTVGAVSREHHPNKNDESEYDREVGIGGRIQLPIRIVWRGFKKDLQANQEHH